MKKLLVPVFFFGLLLPCAGLYGADEVFLPFLTETGQLAYIQPSSGKVIGEGFTYRFAFSEDGLARVRKGDKFGFIDRTGKLVIEPTFDDATDFSGGSAVVTSGGKSGLIATNGTLLIPIEYDTLSNFVEDVACYQKGSESGYLDRSGNLLFTFRKSDPSEPAFLFQGGLAAVRGEFGKGFGYVDKTGKFIIPPSFKSAGPFSKGMAMVIFEDDSQGFIDRNGKTLFKMPPNLTVCDEFHEGLACVCQSDDVSPLFGFIDISGKLVIPCKFNDRSHFSCGLASVRVFTDSSKSDERWGYIDHSGTFVIQPTFLGASDFIKDHAVVSTDWKDSEGLIDKQGNFVLKPEFSRIERTFGDYLILGRKGQEKEKTLLLADPSGKLLAIPKQPEKN